MQSRARRATSWASNPWRTASAECTAIARAAISADTASLHTEVTLSGGRFLYQSTARGVAELRISADCEAGPSLLALELPGWTSPPMTTTGHVWIFPAQYRRGATVFLRCLDGRRRAASLTISKQAAVALFTLALGKAESCAGCTRRASSSEIPSRSG